MTRLDPGRIGRVSMRPPVSQRYSDVYNYAHPSKRRIHAVDGYTDRLGVPCAWCTRTRTTYDYRPADYEFAWFVDTWEDRKRAEHNDIRCCNWACFDKWLDFHFMIINEIEFSFLMGVIPEYVPEWYMPKEVLRSMIAAAGCLEVEYRCSDSERWTAPLSLRKSRR